MTLDTTRNLGGLGSALTTSGGIAQAVNPPAALDSSSNLATTGFVAGTGERFSAVTNVGTTTTLGTGALGSLVNVTAASIIVTLPAAGLCPAGTTISFSNLLASGSATIAANVSDTLSYGQGSSGASLVLAAGTTLQLVSNGTSQWVAGSQGSPSATSGTTPTQFDNSTNWATTAFVQRAIGNFRTLLGITAATTLDATYAGAVVVCNSPSNYTVTLPAVSTLTGGAAIALVHEGTSGTVTISRAGTDVIVVAGSNATSLSLGVGQSVVLATNGSTGWYEVSQNLIGLTATAGDNSTKLSTTAYVATAVSNILSTINAYTSAQYFAQSTLTSGASVAWNLNTQQTAILTLGTNATLANPTNQHAGATYVLIVKQDATGSRTLAYGTTYKWPGGTAPVLSTAASAVDILSFVSDGTNMYGAANYSFA